LIRKEALDRVMMREGAAGIVRLSRMVKIPSLIGQSLRYTSITKEQLLEILRLTGSDVGSGDLSFYVSALGAERYGEHWKSEFKDQVIPFVSSAEEKARLMFGWPLENSTWAFVRTLGDDVYDEYWRQTQALPSSGTLEDLMFAIEQFRRVGRNLEVLCLIHQRIRDLSSELILSLLSEGQKQIVAGQVKIGSMLSYYLNKVLLSLQTREDVKEEDIARQEFAYFPLLVHEKRQMALYSFLSNDPEFFVEVLSYVFRGKKASTDTNPTEQERARAQVSYRLLTSFKNVPGLKKLSIDGGILNKWVDGVREYAEKADLSEIAEQKIGNILAHAPEDPADSFWPPTPICELIEKLASKDIERGITIECFNKRGVVTRGMYSGGYLERDDASRYQRWAIATAQYPRTSALLTTISENWLRHAEHEDVSAELRKMER
jgi:hypothetical protein